MPHLRVFIVLLGSGSDVGGINQSILECAKIDYSIIPVTRRYSLDSFECIVYDTLDIAQFMMAVKMKPKIVLINNISDIMEFEMMVDIFTQEEVEVVAIGKEYNTTQKDIMELAKECNIPVSIIGVTGVYTKLLGES